ncbi:MAG: hypothetical protein COC09_03820 [Gammaproteobacteria bacterium]|nr:DUF1456 family protein [Gammaproteobacteria bacterium]PCH64055.1 MAG: hypothetical protein COC09_03820 [Gammaproteobacteria bacterium]
MTHNDILRRLRYTFDLSDSQMIAMFRAAEHQATRAEISDWLKKEDDPAYQKLKDVIMATFLNGFINQKRGKREGPQPLPEKRLTNNIVFMKLKIALDLKAEEVLSIMELVDFTMSKHELSALFRKASHKNYRECNDQMLRHFLKGLQIKHRGLSENPDGDDEIEEAGESEEVGEVKKDSVWGNNKKKSKGKGKGKSKSKSKDKAEKKADKHDSE